MKDSYQLSKLLRRMLKPPQTKEPLHLVEISNQAKELAGEVTSPPSAAKQPAPPKKGPNHPKEDFLAYQRSLAAAKLMGLNPPQAPQEITKITRSTPQKTVETPEDTSSPTDS